MREEGERYIVLLPVAQLPAGIVVMIPTDEDVACFGDLSQAVAGQWVTFLWVTLTFLRYFFKIGAPN